MPLPSHPFWFWLILLSPFLIWAGLWVLAQFAGISLKPAARWLTAGIFVFAPIHFALQLQGGHKIWRLAASSGFYTCLIVAPWIRGSYRFDRLGAPSTMWCVPWSSASFSIPSRMKIHVRDIRLVSSWYTSKLGLRKLAENSPGDPETEAYSFKDDGNRVVLATKKDFEAYPTPMLFTKKIGKMKTVLTARGVNVGPIERDGSGVRYFEIRDPEGNLIEVVER